MRKRLATDRKPVHSAAVLLGDLAERAPGGPFKLAKDHPYTEGPPLPPRVARVIRRFSANRMTITTAAWMITLPTL